MKLAIGTGPDTPCVEIEIVEAPDGTARTREGLPVLSGGKPVSFDMLRAQLNGLPHHIGLSIEALPTERRKP